MLAPIDLTLETTLSPTVTDRIERWQREIPIYSSAARGARTPFITKNDIRQGFPDNFLRPGQRLDDLLEREAVELEYTSGTSELRTPLLLPRGWWAEQEMRALRLNPFVAEVLDANPGARRITITSPMCNNDICYTGVPSRSERIVGNALFLSLSRFPFLWTEADLARMAREAVDWAPVFLDLDPVYGVAFARYCERQGIRIPSLRFVLCSYEFVSAVHRRLLERVFRVPAFNLYGSTETGHLMMESEDGLMRPSLETASLEVIDPDDAGIGELIVTTLTNEFMPLIRYRIGDLVEPLPGPETRYVVHGRVNDAVQQGDRRVTLWQIDQCVAETGELVHYQLRSGLAGEFLFHFIPDSKPPGSREIGRLEECLGSLLGAKVTAESTDLLMPESSGKFRLCYADGARIFSRPDQM